MGNVVVHRGSPEAVISVAHHLREAGLDASVIDHPNFVILMISFGTYKSRVVVPEAEAQAAFEELERWSEESREEVQHLTRQLGSQALLATAFSVATGLFAYSNADPSDPGKRAIIVAFALGVSWILSFIVITTLATVWRRRD